MDWLALILFVLSIMLLTAIFIIIRTQLVEKNVSGFQLLENKQLLRSIIDNTKNAISIKKLNGEYLLINKQYESLFHIAEAEIIGKTDHDFLPEDVADSYRNSDMEVVKVGKEIKVEEKITNTHGLRTYLAVKFPLFDATNRIYAIGTIATDITERKEAEAAFKEGDMFFRMSPDILVIASKDSFIKFNPALSKTLGYSEHEMKENPFLSFVLLEDKEITKKEILKLSSGNTTINFENRWVCKDGTIKWLDWTASGDATTGLLYAVAHDVTEQKEMEMKLLMTDQFFEMSFDIMFVTKDNKFIKTNRAFKKELGFSEAELIDKTLVDILHPDQQIIGNERIASLSRGAPSTKFVYQVLCKDGNYKLMEVVATANINEGLIFSVGRNVTDRQENEESLKMAEQFFNMSFDILAVEKANHFMKVNPSFTRNLGFNEIEMKNLSLAKLVHPEDQSLVEKVMEKLNKGETIVSYRDRVLCKDQSIKWLEWNITIDKNAELIYACARNITEQKELETEQQNAINELYENEEKLRVILENINEAVIVTDPQKNILMANYMANELYVLKEDTITSANLSDKFELYFPDEKTIFPSQNLPLERALNGESTDDVDVVLFNPNSEQKKRVLISGRPLIDTENHVVAAVLTIKDISRYKQLEQELIDAESKYRRLIGFKKDEEEKL
jgi:PAS domain S-box-containing protein